MKRRANYAADRMVSDALRGNRSPVGRPRSLSQVDKKMATKPIFLSRPTVVPPSCEKEAFRFERFLNGHGFHSVRLGGSAYSTKAPLQAVIDLMKSSVGAIILGFPKQSIVVRGFTKEVAIDLPTPWNHIEGALAYALERPTLVVVQAGIEGGVFDHGITGEFVMKVDFASAGWFQTPAFQGVFDDWKKKV